MERVAETDRLGPDLRPVLMGLFGEVGGIMATAKKYRREGSAFAGYRNAVEEEFGDALWYLAAICRRLRLDLDTVFSDTESLAQSVPSIVAIDLLQAPIARAIRPENSAGIDETLLSLGKAAADLLDLAQSTERAIKLLSSFAGAYVRSIRAAEVSFSTVTHKNIAKTRGRFLQPDFTTLPKFDDQFSEEERIPEHFEIALDQMASGRAYMRWNGVFIGDPLTDNIVDPDGYRFHDVFHFAHAAILHWSPTFRALIKQKRKSDSKIDEAQDGGRAIVVEEGLTAWIFARAKELNYFEGQTSVSFDLLKTVQQFVTGYEVQSCPLRLWEIAILQGYEVFRQMKEMRGGLVVCDRGERRIWFKPLPAKG
jgi:hypothetical protein